MMGRGRSHQGERREREWGSCSSASGAKVTGFKKRKKGVGVEELLRCAPQTLTPMARLASTPNAASTSDEVAA